MGNRPSPFRRRMFDLIDEINMGNTSGYVEKLFIDALGREGFETVGARAIGNPFDDRYVELPEIYNGPDELRRIWHERRYIRNDPTVLRALTTQIPFIWTQYDGKTPIGKRILSDAADFGLREGVALPVHSLDQKPACVSLSGAGARELSKADLLTLGLAATHFFVIWSAQFEPGEVDIIGELTPRERDVLYCAAAGLTGEGVCEHLGIRSSSVKSHMKSIRHKLNANSMAHAVAKGIHFGLISP